MDLYTCQHNHRFFRAPGDLEEFIPCAYCQGWARFAGRVDEQVLAGDAPALRK